MVSLEGLRAALQCEPDGSARFDSPSVLRDGPHHEVAINAHESAWGDRRVSDGAYHLALRNLWSQTACDAHQRQVLLRRALSLKRRLKCDRRRWHQRGRGASLAGRWRTDDVPEQLHIGPSSVPAGIRWRRRTRCQASVVSVSGVVLSGLWHLRQRGQTGGRSPATHPQGEPAQEGQGYKARE